MTDDATEITRRHVLATLGSIGTAGALGGAGTAAYFTTRETTASSFTSGELDLTLHVTRTYHGTTIRTDTGTVDGNRAVLFDRENVQPGDWGRIKFCFELTTSPAYLWLGGRMTTDHGTLDRAIELTIQYCGSDGADGAVIVEERSLRNILPVLTDGIPLDFEGDVVEAGQQAPYQPNSSGRTTGPCVCIEWKIPGDVGSEIQSDDISFELQFHAIQARHNDGTENPVMSTTGSHSDDG